MVEAIITLLGLAVQAWQTQATGGAKNTADLAEILLQIAQKANRAYTDQTGKPIDPSLLKPIDPLP